MKILIVTDAWAPQVNGVVRTVRATRDELQRLGHQVEVMEPGWFRSVPCPGYPEIRLALASRAAVARAVDAFGPEALHIATEGPLGWQARSLARSRGWSFSTAYHTRFPEYLHARVRLPLSITHRVLRRFHAAAGATLVATPTLARELGDRGYGPLRPWGRGVDVARFRPEGGRIARRTGTPVFLYVGRLAVEKNVDAFLRLSLPGEKWVVGDGPEAARLRAAYPDARWFGTLHGESLARVYRSADVTVFPSLTDTFGLVMLESMACGTPVAAFAVPGPLDVVGDSRGGALDADLGEACRRALSLSREDALARAATFTWAGATRQFLDALPPLGEPAPLSAVAVPG